MEWLFHMADVFGRRHDPLWGWITVFVFDWAIGALCILMPLATMKLRRSKSQATGFISQVFCGCMAIHFALLPVASFTRVWQIRLATDIALLLIFIVCYNRALSLARERERGLL